MNLRPTGFRIALLLIASFALAAPTGPRAEFMPWEEAAPIVASSAADALPQDIAGKKPQQLMDMWPDWVREQDKQVRERLAKGDEDSLVNLLLFGTSFTRQPRLAAEFFEKLRAGGDSDKMQAELQRAIAGRAHDMVVAMAAPQRNERIAFMRRLVVAKGFGFSTPQEKQKTALFLVQEFDRARAEFTGYRDEIRKAQAGGDQAQEMAVRARLFATRGVSLDTSWRPNMAIEDALRDLLAKGVLTRSSAQRLAVVGPGLDFVDKSEGYDFYPLQTIQPFALMDSALRLGLADREHVRVTSLDISERVNQHLARMRQRGAEGKPYNIQMLRETNVPWTAEAKKYWDSFADQIAKPAVAVQPPSNAGKLKTRAVRVPADLVLRVDAADLNAVYERLTLPASERYDVIIGTNIFVYYGPFEQSLVLANAAQMLRPGGVLLSNNLLPDTPSSGMESLGYVTTVYSERAEDGDQIFIYRKKR
ncbi:MAG: class I SAM-dependent methyltransferase [Candidatus Koribacter versatilis]|uniref:Class I SAM-dependent methyltransferase n=1 Tax=Candidatus Korobacter versatilis TaxID=658062 RepID=A0A932EP52_9BACT|nr:class I SAM-dependent methyltransferase [Candidatus Koribacter versatilis]